VNRNGRTAGGRWFATPVKNALSRERRREGGV
jgi:hypothetical protein